MSNMTINTVIEVLVFSCSLGLLIILLNTSISAGLNRNRGWRFIVTGYCFILFALFVDILEDYFLTQGNYYLLKIILEGAVGFLLGFIILSIGVWQWIPQVMALQNAKNVLRKSQAHLKCKLMDYSLQLEEEKRKSQAADEQKQAFLNNMSHELRTPLNGIIGCVEIIMNTKTSPEQKEYLERANQSSDDLLNIINNILDLKDIERDDLTIYKKHFLIEPFIIELISKYELMAKKKQIQFNWSLDHRVPKTLFGSPDQLKIALSKILENSITYTERGQIEIEISSEDIGNNKINLSFKISDTGVGIPSEFHDSIFSEFTKIPYDNVKPSPGLGLGLSVANNLLKKMNGEVYLENSELTKGSIFNVTVPLNIVE